MKKFLSVLMLCVLSLSVPFEAFAWSDGVDFPNVLVAAAKTKKKAPAKKKAVKKQSGPVMKLSRKQWDEFFQICHDNSLEKFVAKLEEANISPNAKYHDSDDNWDSNLLMLATSMTSNIKIIEFLLSKGADVNTRDNYGFSPLTNAIRNQISGTNNEEFVDALLRAGANINAKDHLGRTPLMFALDEDHDGSLLGSPKIISLLLDAGAEVNARDKHNQRAVDYARKREELKGTEILRRLEEASR